MKLEDSKLPPVIRVFIVRNLGQRRDLNSLVENRTEIARDRITEV
jgi:hypothetical protein